MTDLLLAAASTIPLQKVVNYFLMGAVAMGYGVAGLFFVRFWTKTRDRLFLMFGIAFWLLGSNRLIMAVIQDMDEHHYFYWVRFAAYVLILLAIIDKNRQR